MEGSGDEAGSADPGDASGDRPDEAPRPVEEGLPAGVVPDRLEPRKLALFLALAFGIAWTTAGVIHLLGGLSGAPELLPGIPVWVPLLVGPYMWAPALAHAVTRYVTDDAWSRDAALLRLTAREHARYWLASWLLPVALILAGAAVYFLAYPDRYGGLAAVERLLADLEAQTGDPVPFTPEAFVLIQFWAALGVSPVINSLATFGEEFGWRGYLLPKLAPLGWRPALLVHGVVWGVWHWPIIAMGHNYGTGYPGFPWVGLAAMATVTVPLGVVLGWLTLRSDSVGPPTVGHAMINGAAGLAALGATEIPNQVLGPTPVGLLGVVPWAVLSLALFVRTDWLLPVGESATGESPAD